MRPHLFALPSALFLLAACEPTGSTARRVAVMPLPESVRAIAAPGFVTTPGARLLEVDACPGAPLCPRATVDTRALARQLAPRTRGRLHVSGCAKGCANPRAADITLVGRDGGFDLVRNGTAADPPARRGLAPSHLIDLIGMT